jgi:hypothetical protein
LRTWVGYTKENILYNHPPAGEIDNRSAQHCAITLSVSVRTDEENWLRFDSSGSSGGGSSGGGGSEPVRLNKRLSELGNCSRRESDSYIERGLVTVDGRVVSALGTKVTREQRVEIWRGARKPGAWS